MTTAKNILSEYHNTSASTSTDSWLISTIRTICATPVLPMQPHGFLFTCTKKTAKHNASILRKHDYDLAAAYASFPNSIISPGAEYHDPSTLEPLLHRHEKWAIFRDILTRGADYPLLWQTPDDYLLTELKTMIHRGNHKPSTLPIHRDKLLNGYRKVTSLGWQIPVSVECITFIPGAMVVPLGVAKQLIVIDDGVYVDKFRITHDCNYKYSNWISLNNIVDMDSIPPCEYGV